MNKIYLKGTSILLSLLLLACPLMAQNGQAQDTDALKEQVKQLESIDMNGKSASVQMIRKRTLLKLYEQLQGSLEKDAADLQAILKAISGSNSSDQQEVSAQLRKIEQEKKELRLKIDALRGDLQGASTASAPTPSSSAPTTPSPSRERRASSASSEQQSYFTRNINTGVAASPNIAAANSSDNRVSIADIESDKLPSNATSSSRPAATPTPIPQSLNDDLNNRISSVARANIEQRSPSKQTEAAAASTNSTSLANQAQAGDFVNVAANLAGLNFATKNSAEDTNSVTVTTSAYLFLSQLYNVDPLNPYFYNKYEGWRRLSFTLGYDDEKVGTTNQTERTKLFGFKYVIVNKREPSRQRNQRFLADVTNSLRQASVRFGNLTEEISAHVFINKKVREKIVIPQFRAFLTSKQAQLRAAGAASATDLARVDTLLTQLNNPAPSATSVLFAMTSEGLPPQGVDRTGVDPQSWTEEELEFYTDFRVNYLSLDYRNKLKTDAGEEVLADIDGFIEKKLQDTTVFEDLDTVASEAIENIRRAPQLSFNFLTKQRKTGSDEYQSEAIYEYGLADRLNLTLNGTFNYLDSNTIGGDTRQGKFTGQFRFQLTPDDRLIGRRPVFFFLTGQGEAQSGRFPIYRAQAKITIPVMDGVDLPLAFTYASRNAEGKKDTLKGQFSFTVDTARLYKLFTSSK